MIRYKCIVAYDGSFFHGFQIQKKLRTVQLEIEDVLQIIHKKPVRIFSAGRTDTGVHAYYQVFHFDSDIEMKEENMRNAINTRLPKDIYIRKVEITNCDFHARFSSHKKKYQYIIDLGEYNPLLVNYRYYYRYNLDINKMIDAKNVFVGKHDFKSFTKNHKIKDTIREIYAIDFVLENDNKLIKINFSGNGFLHNMVRIIVAMLIEVGNGRKTKEDLQEIMDCKDRTFAPKTAPANGLYLMHIEY